MCQKLFALCICYCIFVIKVPVAAQLLNLPLNPDVEILPPVGAVSSQFMHRIHNRLLSAPIVAPIIGGNPTLFAAPIRTFPTPGVPIPAPQSNFALSAQLPLLRSPLTLVPRPPIGFVPVSQQLAPSFGVLPQPLVSSSIVPAPTRLIAPAALAVASARFALAPLISARLRNRLGFRRRPLPRRYATGVVY